MIHFKPRSKRVFILGTVKPAHLFYYIIPAMASTRGKLLFNCFRAHVHASTRCLLSKEAPFQQPLCNDGPGWPSGWATPTRSCSGCLHYFVYPMIRPPDSEQVSCTSYICYHCYERGNLKFNNSSFKFQVLPVTRSMLHHPRPGQFLQ
jgi:hypothetical protein